MTETDSSSARTLSVAQGIAERVRILFGILIVLIISLLFLAFSVLYLLFLR